METSRGDAAAATWTYERDRRRGPSSRLRYVCSVARGGVVPVDAYSGRALEQAADLRTGRPHAFAERDANRRRRADQRPDCSGAPAGGLRVFRRVGAPLRWGCHFCCHAAARVVAAVRAWRTDRAAIVSRGARIVAMAMKCGRSAVGARSFRRCRQGFEASPLEARELVHASLRELRGPAFVFEYSTRRERIRCVQRASGGVRLREDSKRQFTFRSNVGRRLSRRGIRIVFVRGPGLDGLTNYSLRSRHSSQAQPAVNAQHKRAAPDSLRVAAAPVRTRAARVAAASPPTRAAEDPSKVGPSQK